MKLYIQIENGQPVNHPAFEQNLVEVFGSIPENWEPFNRIERPMCDVYQVVSEEPVYEKINEIWTDVWTIRDMTEEEEEKINKQKELDEASKQAVKDFWATLPNRENFSSWVFDEEIGQYLPPIPRPTEGDFRWDGALNSWVPRT
jgi:hypothetical protein